MAQAEMSAQQVILQIRIILLHLSHFLFLQRTQDFAQLQKEYRLMEMNRKVCLTLRNLKDCVLLSLVSHLVFFLTRLQIASGVC
jgi:hypothetical protein